MFHNVYTFFSVHNCLDEDFDALDIEADRALCRAIAAGRAGMHPEAWSSRSDLMAVMPQGFNGSEWVPEPYRPPIDRSELAAEQEAKHRQRPVEQPKPEPHRRKWKPPPDVTYGPPMAGGDMQLTCDDCGKRRFKSHIHHDGGPVPSDKQGRLWELAREAGWLIFGGRDLCPKCALATAVYACAILNRQTMIAVER